jgi:hypothetical protein
MAEQQSKPDGMATRLWREWGRGLAIAVAAGLFLAIAAPFQTGLLPLSQRLFYWVGLMLLGAIWGHIASDWVFKAGRFDERRWLGGLILTLLIAAPYTVLVWLVTGLITHSPPKLETLPYYVGPVLMVSAAMTGISMLAYARPRETHASPAGAPPPKFLDRMPLKLKGAEIWAVEAEDHYLRIHTDRGSDLILMRLSDAVGELEGLEGAQTHRSWWVAKPAVVGIKRNDGRATFTLKNGVEAPVSRTYARVLREEGWY